MSNQNDIGLMAHLMRRAGFGAPRSKIEELAEMGYDRVVDQLLDPDNQPALDEATFFRYHPMADLVYLQSHPKLDWLYRMVNSEHQLVEKTTLFWHHVFATGVSKVMSGDDMHAQVALFREHGLGNLRDLLVRLGKDPAMIYWLDNNENHKRAPNENWGRELLELFTVGVGSYTEKDVYEGSRAFTGWTFSGKVTGIQLGPLTWNFEYRPEDHDGSQKSLLGHASNLNGEDAVDIIVRQPACARFISRHLYNFFVADEPPVPTWSVRPPRDPEAISFLAQTFLSSGLEIKPVLRALFTSDFFKEAQFQRVRSPSEVVAATLRLTGDLNGPDPRWTEVVDQTDFMGQELLNPPSVEGWHTGREWINSGALMNRVNFVADQVSNTELPGVRDIARRIAESNGAAMTAEDLVDKCLDLIGPLPVSEETRRELVAQAEGEGTISSEGEAGHAEASRRVGDVLALIAGTREYQFG